MTAAGTRKAVKKLSPKKRKKPSSVLFDSSLKSQRKAAGARNPRSSRSAHFTQQTYSSCKKRQPATVMRSHSPSHSTPFQNQKPPKHKRRPSPKLHTRTPSPPPHPHPPPPHQHHPLTPSPPSPPSPREAGDNQLAKEAWVGASLAQQAEEIEQLKNETKRQLSELKAQLLSRPTERHRSPLKQPKKPTKDEPFKGDTNLRAPTEEGHKEQQQETVVSMERAAMLCRLEEMEAEEEVIRQRWHCIAYEDPLTSQPAVLLHGKTNGPGTYMYNIPPLLYD